MKYRKKPVVVEARQFLKDDPSTWHPKIVRYTKADRFWINTLEGAMEVSDGDWIITGIKGETYPCKPDVFEATYEPA